MKKIIIIMLVLLTVGVVFGYDAVATAYNRANRVITVGMAFHGTNNYRYVTTLSHGSADFLGWSGLPYDIIAVIGTDINIRIPGYYEIKQINLEPGSCDNNRVSFDFSNLEPVDPGNPGQSQ